MEKNYTVTLTLSVSAISYDDAWNKTLERIAADDYDSDNIEIEVEK